MSRESTRSAWKVTLAVVIFGAVHSALAAQGTKQWFARRFGERRRNALYRPTYNVAAIASTAALFAYVWRQKSEPIYEVHGAVRYLMVGGQLLACAELVRGLSAIGWSGFAGLPGVSAYIRGEDDVPMEPEGQGPSLRGDSVHIRGPFRYSRHPLNALTIVLLWLNPRMTTTVLALNISSTVYLVLGSFHEEVRLRIRYGEAYEGYVRSHVNFLA